MNPSNPNSEATPPANPGAPATTGGAGYGIDPAQGAPRPSADGYGMVDPAAAAATGLPPVSPAGPRIIETDAAAKDGLSKCARCGATEISLNPATGMLRCGFCRFEWATGSAEQALGLNSDISELSGLVMGSGSQDIVPSTDVVLTFKCSACGAEVVINTDESTQARCHWCRNKLSMNQQIPNGAVPDMVLPFALRKEQATEKISQFVKKRRFYAHPKFLKEFEPENVMGVYLPYMVVDINAHARLTGQGEHQTRTYTVKRGDNTQRVYDADIYHVMRDFDVYINDLTVESSSERRDQDSSRNTNNIINTIMPFDVENAVRYDSNYLAGFTSQRRDTNIDDLTPLVDAQARDITRYRVNDTLRFYDRGVRWDSEQVDVKGQRWASAYLPVWLYSYQQRRSNGQTFLHYVAVNARTGETMGSVPINKPKLFAVSAVVQVVGMVLGTIIMVVGG
ncbi:TFIIB-type zinc ribbon-containing protein [Pseudactinotalea sp. HY158]|uniref:TFIIB-type zinc ribbon-containing protein n=1 Tax=unclassified Pseudactinotalea TaxID=2649176 RepID=UPI001E4DF386|nr:TFIIB-type zinc ribbon-containing protein [Pseudactinotalea sp. HY158]